MAKKRGDGDQQEPTLELPSLFGRRKKKRGPVEPDEQAQAPTQPVEPVQGAEPVEDTQPVAPPEPARVRDPEPVAEPAPEPGAGPEPEQEPEAEPAPVPAARRKSRRTTPLLPPAAAALLTGLVIGLVGTALTYGSLRGCEMLRGTESCGGSGLGLLLVIVVLMMLGGAVALKLLRVSEPRGTSFLAVGLMCVVVLVTLMEELFSVWMFVAIPLICAVSYVLAHWVTTQFVETVDDRPHVDVR